MAERVLVIKLSALGDVVQALGPMAAIRHYHGAADLTALTTPAYAPLLRASGLFDQVWECGRPRGLSGLLALRRRLRAARFERVYDLQTSSRSSWYFHLMQPGAPEWSGIAWGCSHPHANPRRAAMHTLDRQAEQLLMAGIPETPLPDLAFARADLSRFALPERFALLVPGGAAHRPDKRWPLARYVALAGRLMAEGHVPVVLGGPEEAAMAAAITTAVPGARDLTRQTALLELAVLGQEAALAIGNDTGPMHVLSLAGAPSLVLFGPASDPARCGQRGRAVQILRAADLAALTVDQVLAAARDLLPAGERVSAAAAR